MSQKCFFNFTAKLVDKIETAVEPRFLEDEGFFVGERPVIPNGVLNKMENRLIQEHKADKVNSVHSFNNKRLYSLQESNNTCQTR